MRKRHKVNLIRIKFPIWRAFFLATGLYTVVLGIVILCRILGSPVKNKRFTDAEKMAILLRVKVNHSGTQSAKLKQEQVFEAMGDLRLYLVAFCAFLGAIPNGAVTAFCSMLIVSFEFEFRIGLLLTTPVGSIGVITILLCGYLSDRWRDRSTVILIAVTPSLIAVGLFYGSSGEDGIVTKKDSLLAATIMLGTVGASFMVLLAWNASNIAGHSKKIFANCITVIGFGMRNIVGIQCFAGQQAPGYVTGKIAICLALALMYPVVWGLRIRNNKLNAENAKKLANMSAEQQQELKEQFAFADVTDRWNPFCVYTH